MSTDTRDGIAPSLLRSTVKQLVFGLLPDRKSSQLTEALASGCGYASNAAYMADVKDDTACVLLPVTRIDRDAMATRLAGLSGTPAGIEKILVSTALDLVSRTLPGNVVPVGGRSTILRSGEVPYGTLPGKASGTAGLGSSGPGISLADGTPFPYRIGVGSQDPAVELVYGPTGQGKSIFVHANLLATARENPDRLPMIGIVEAGRNAEGLVSAIRRLIPSVHHGEVRHIKLRNVADDAINPFDTPLGCRRPTPLDRVTLVHVVALLGGADHLNLSQLEMELAGYCIDAVYDHFSDRSTNSQPKRYVAKANVAIDDLLRKHGIEANPLTPWWEIVDSLFSLGEIDAAAAAQRFAVPLALDISVALALPRAAEIFGPSSKVEGEDGVEAFRLRYMANLKETPLLWVPTRLPSANVTAIDVSGAAPRGSGRAELQSCLAYILATSFVSRNLYVHKDIVDARENGMTLLPDIYRDHHMTRIDRIALTPKFLVLEDYHRASSADAMRIQLLTYTREARRYGIGVVVTSQLHTDFVPALVDMATGYWVLGVHDDRAAGEVETIFGLSPESSVPLRNQLRGPVEGGVTILTKLSRYPHASFEGTVRFAPSPEDLWALTGNPRDIDLRESVFGIMAEEEALRRLAMHFPTGTAEIEMERRGVLGMPGTDERGNAIIDLATEIAAA